MNTYVEKNLSANEKIEFAAEFNGLFLIWKWILGILFFWLLLIPTIKAITATITFHNRTLCVTDKRVIGRTGVFETKSIDSPLNKIDSVVIHQTLGGKIFNYSTVVISSASNSIYFEGVKSAEKFKKSLMEKIYIYSNNL